MYRLGVLGVVASLLAAGPASAAPFGELPFTPVTGRASCLRATGAPGELVRSTREGLRFMTASPAGIADAGELKLDGDPLGCPAVASQPNGAGVLAVPSRFQLQVAVREPGGTWSPLAALDDADELGGPLAAAVSDRGDAVVAWVRTRDGRIPVHRLVVARRTAGGPFGPPQVVATLRTPSGPPPLQVGISASGEALVAWSVPPRIDPDSLALDDRPGSVDVAVAGPQARFAVTHGVAQSSQLSAPALAVARDGRALLAAFDGESVRVAQRAPGQPFGVAAPVARAADALSIQPGVALGPGGAAVVAWSGRAQGGAGVVTRPDAGAFGAPVTITRPRSLHGSDTVLLAVLRLFAGALGGALASLSDDVSVNTTATITADGRALITSGGAGGDLGLPVLRAASLPVAGGHLDAQAVSGTLRDPGQNTPVTLADGRTAVAWADNRPGLLEGGGRLHLALEGVSPAADPPRPTITVGRPLRTTLRAKDALQLPVRCSAACEISAYETRSGAFARLELSKAGAGTLEIGGILEPPLAPLHRGPVRIHLLYGGPGAKHSSTKVVTLRLRRPAGPRLPEVRDLRARRHGTRIEVSWRTDIPADPGDFAVIGTRTRSLDELPIALTLGEDDRKRTRFRLTLARTDRVRFVTVVSDAEPLRFDRRATVGVR